MRSCPPLPTAQPVLQSLLEAQSGLSIKEGIEKALSILAVQKPASATCRQDLDRGWGQRGGKAHATARLPRVVKHATTCRDSGSCRRFCFKLKHEQENRPPPPTLTLQAIPLSLRRTHTHSQALSLLAHLSVCPSEGLFASLSCLLISSPPVAALEDPSYAPPPQPCIRPFFCDCLHLEWIPAHAHCPCTDKFSKVHLEASTSDVSFSQGDFALKPGL